MRDYDSKKDSEETRILPIKLTRKRKAIVKYLCIYGETGHSQLAIALGYSACSLSNLIAKMQENEDVLLSVRKTGRNKFYSLTELGKSLAEEIISNEKQQNDGTRKSMPEYEEDIPKQKDALQVLDQLQKAWRGDWKNRFLAFLDGKINDDEITDNDIRSIKQLLVIIEGFEEKGEDDLLENIYAEVEDELVISKIKDVSYRMMGMRLLCSLDEGEREQAYDIVDGFFKCKGLAGLWNLFEEVNVGLEKDQYCCIVAGLSGFLNDVEKMGGQNGRINEIGKFYFDSHRKLQRYVLKSFEKN